MAYKIKNKKLTCKKVDYLIKDERKASKEYHELGFHNIARDESRHAEYFKKIKKQRCK